MTLTIHDHETHVLDPADLINFDSLLTAEELALRSKVRTFVDEAIKPNIAGWYADAVFPLEIVPEMTLDVGVMAGRP